MRIRHALPEDWLAWERMRYALWPGDDETHGEVITAFFSGLELPDPAAVLLAEEDDRAVAGFAELSVRTDLPKLEDTRVGYVEGLYVLPVARHRGVARRLLDASRTWSRAQGCSRFASDRDDRLIIDPRPL